MKKIILSILFLYCINVYAQDTVYAIYTTNLKPKIAKDIKTVNNIVSLRLNQTIDVSVLFNNSNFFEIRNYNFIIYCEKKEVRGVRRNGKLKLKKLKQK